MLGLTEPTDGILNWVIGVVLDGVFNLSIGTIIDVCCSIVPKESRKNRGSHWCQLEHTEETFLSSHIGIGHENKCYLFWNLKTKLKLNHHSDNNQRLWILEFLDFFFSWLSLSWPKDQTAPHQRDNSVKILEWTCWNPEMNTSTIFITTWKCPLMVSSHPTGWEDLQRRMKEYPQIQKRKACCIKAKNRL